MNRLLEDVYQLIRKYDSTTDDKAGFELHIYNPVLFRQELGDLLDSHRQQLVKEIREELEEFEKLHNAHDVVCSLCKSKLEHILALPELREE